MSNFEELKQRAAKDISAEQARDLKFIEAPIRAHNQLTQRLEETQRRADIIASLLFGKVEPNQTLSITDIQDRKWPFKATIHKKILATGWLGHVIIRTDNEGMSVRHSVEGSVLETNGNPVYFYVSNSGVDKSGPAITIPKVLELNHIQNGHIEGRLFTSLSDGIEGLNLHSSDMGTKNRCLDTIDYGLARLAVQHNLNIQ